MNFTERLLHYRSTVETAETDETALVLSCTCAVIFCGDQPQKPIFAQVDKLTERTMATLTERRRTRSENPGKGISPGQSRDAGKSQAPGWGRSGA
jgi:hypothetical protein